MLLALVVFVAVCETFLLRPKFLLAITMLQIGIFNLLEVGVQVQTNVLAWSRRLLIVEVVVDLHNLLLTPSIAQQRRWCSSVEGVNRMVIEKAQGWNMVCKRTFCWFASTSVILIIVMVLSRRQCLKRIILQQTCLTLFSHRCWMSSFCNFVIISSRPNHRRLPHKVRSLCIIFPIALDFAVFQVGFSYLIRTWPRSLIKLHLIGLLKRITDVDQKFT